MSLAVIWLPEAMTAYRRLRAADPDGARQIAKAVAALGTDPCPTGSSALGGTAFRRLYLDRYRVLYEVAFFGTELRRHRFACYLCQPEQRPAVGAGEAPGHRVSLPIIDRRTSFDFYRHGLGFDVIGEPAEDGVPEPLQFMPAGDVNSAAASIR